ncbi:MAG TPA: ABC transporter substrate-binding protein [Solirubrobacteraceae bacterium]|nr:ABC transporter substrate-binding protein [Solirubrobacteraceae bacterium]
MPSEVPRRSARRVARRAIATTGLAALAALSVAVGTSAATSRPHSSSVGAANHQVAADGTVIAGTLPSAGKVHNGGKITIGQLYGQTPLAIFPITTGGDSGTPSNSLVTQLYTPLFYGPNGARPEVNYNLSVAARAPVASQGDKTYTIYLKHGLKWSDGQPVDAQDVVFYIDLLKAALGIGLPANTTGASVSNWGQYAPGLFPTNLASVSTPNQYEVVLHLTKAYNPGYFLYNQLQDTNWGIYPLPAQAWDIDATGGSPVTDWATNPADALKIYTYLEAQGTTLSTFASNPLWQTIDGPFKLTSFSTVNSSYTLAPNTKYTGPAKAHVSQISVNTYTSETAQLNALKDGSLDLGGLDAATQLASIPQLKSEGYSVFGTPGFGWYGGIINFKDTTNHFNKIITQPYVDEALDELIDQPAIITGVYHGWAVPASGPIPSAPDSPYAPPNSSKPVYPYDPTAAAKLLKAHGWDVKPGGQTVCAKAGSGKGDCGAGIPKGTKFAFTWANVPESVAATGVLESEAFASSAEQYAGVKINLVSKTFNFLVTDYNDTNPAAAKYDNDWAVNNFGGIQFDYYPTQYGLLSPGAGFNFGDFNNSAATKLMTNSAYSISATAVQKEDEYLSKNYPVFFMPDEDQIYAVSKRLGGSPAAFLQLGTQVWAGSQFYVK